MKYKPNQRVAYYEVTGKSEPCPAKVDLGSILSTALRASAPNGRS